ncbi:MAG: branched-chain amino acid ABC transporter substrate-binding protein [Planctomycetota bacterium]
MPRPLPAILTLLALTAFGCGRGAPAPAVIKIGMAGPLTGPQSRFGTDIINGVTLAVDEWNEKGGVLGKKIVIVRRDDEAQEKMAVPVARELVNEGVAGVIGHFNSGCTIPASEKYHEAGIPLITPSATNPQVTDRGYGDVFRLCGRDDQQGPIGADYAIDTVGAKKFAVLHDKTTYGQGLADEFKKQVEKRLGPGAIVHYGGFPKEEKDFRAILDAVKTKSPDLWYFGGIYHQGGPLVRQARDIGLTAPFMSGDGVIDPEFLKTGQTAAEGSFLTFAPDLATVPTAADFVKKYDARFGLRGPYAVYAYDAANILIKSIAKAGATDGKAVSAAIRGTVHEGALGKIAFDAKGDIRNSFYVMWTVKDGKFVMCK